MKILIAVLCLPLLLIAEFVVFCLRPAGNVRVCKSTEDDEPMPSPDGK